MRLPKIIALLSVIVFAASLTQKCFDSEGQDPKTSLPGSYCLLLGAIGLFDGIFEWLANPVLFYAWVLSFLGKNKIVLVLGIVASALMLAFLFRHTIIASEARTYAKIIGYRAGYWLWLTSGVLTIVSGATGLVKQK